MSDKTKAGELLEMLEKLTSESDNDEEEEKYDEKHIDNLQKTYKSLLIKYEYKPGQLIKWKKGLRNRALPKENQPAIVIEALKEVLIENERDTGSTYYREPLDIILGLIDSTGHMITFHYDSRRFEPY
jgi:hypothetical protein